MTNLEFSVGKYYRTRDGRKAQIDHKTLLEMFEYDKEKGALVWKNRRPYGKHTTGSIAGAVNNRGYVGIKIKYKSYLVHRLIWFYVYGTWPRDQIDHINGIQTDNRICNLREVNTRENCRNKAPHRAGKLPGCTLKNKKWNAKIHIKGKSYSIGTYSTEREAHEAYLKRVQELEEIPE